MEKRVRFNGRMLPYLLLFPQIAATLIFFIWPAIQAVWLSTLQEDMFGTSSTFAGLFQYKAMFQDAHYWRTVGRTMIYSLYVAGFGMALSLMIAVAADRVLRARGIYRSLLVWPYAVAPAIAGALWEFMFSPSVGIVSQMLGDVFGYEFNAALNRQDAFTLIVVAAVWNHMSYNFLFFLAGLQQIPKSLIEAAAIDGAGPLRRLFTIVMPLLSPTAFFLLVVNVIYAFFGTFGIIDATTQGGPAYATETMVYKVYRDGLHSHDIGGSSAQSVVLMLLVATLTIIQFRYIERRVHY